MPRDGRFSENKFFRPVFFPVSILTLARPIHRVLFFGLLGLTLAIMPLSTLQATPELSIWKRLFGWSPTEGMTRGVCAFLHGDVKTAISFHVLSIPAALLAAAIVIKDSVALLKKRNID